MTHQKIAVSEIRRWMNTICDALEMRGISQIDVEQEGYWDVFYEEAYDFSRQPEPQVGSLSDDIADLRKEMEAFHSDDIGMVVDHACHHLQGIVKYLSVISAGPVVSASDRSKGGAHG
ncbi:hypothetical protein ACETIH_04195 [Microvirga arabica]|jgi:hypothetical protein|uniref:Uncharacterized protein n=1 Tax=Microvirga arabica TaxID=1128671 RepID=A0ABV6Y3S6_9HYPH